MFNSQPHANCFRKEKMADQSNWFYIKFIVKDIGVENSYYREKIFVAKEKQQFIPLESPVRSNAHFGLLTNSLY